MSEIPTQLVLAGDTYICTQGYVVTSVQTDGVSANFAGESTTAPRALAGTYSATDGACLESFFQEVVGAWTEVYNHSTGANLRIFVESV